MISFSKSFSITILFLIVIVFASCNESKKSTAYQCPMECQIDTAYVSPGKCPVCEMDLKAIEIPADKKVTILKN